MIKTVVADRGLAVGEGREPRSSAVGRAAAAVAVASGVATALVTVATVYRLHVPLPYWDEWFTIIHFSRFAAGGYGLTDLAAQHNEHRLLFPRLFFFADAALFDLSGVLTVTATLVLQLVDAVALIALMVRLVARPSHRALLAGFVLTMLFTLRQEQNFSNGFQLQFVEVFTAALLAGVAYAAALDRLRAGRGSAAWFALAALGCGVSAYSMANGVLAGAVLAVAAALRRAPWPVPVATAALSAALAAVFFHGYVPGGSTYAAAEAVSHAWAYPRFFTAYLGNPLGSDVRATQALGTVGLALTAGAAWRVAAGRAEDGASLALLVLAGFVLATDAATAYGRIVSGTQQAFESRYATPSLLFWTALVLFWFPVAVRTGASAAPRFGAARVPAALLAALMLLLGGAALAFEATAWPELAVRSAGLRRVSDSLLVGLYDAKAAETYESTEASAIASFVPFLREHRLAAFADPDYPRIGRPIGAAASAACDGTVSAEADPALGPGGVRLAGRAVDDAARRAPRRIMVADASGTVVGLGSASLPGRPSRLWTGYAVARPGAGLQAYARLADGALCRFGVATVD